MKHYIFSIKLKMSIQRDSQIVFLAILLVALWFLLNDNIGINLVDEGFLWYGTWRTFHGEVPLLNFQSYDPGRYYWSAIWYKVFGEGIISLRIAIGFFQILGLSFGLFALRRAIHSWWLLAIAGVFLLVWMFPRWKIFEASISMTAVYFAVLLIENPSFCRHFIAGVFAGIAAFFGRNHGLYCFVAFFLLILFVWFRIERSSFLKKVGVWGVGIFIGYLPMLLMLILISGYFDVLIRDVIFSIENTNLPRPVPWPWKEYRSIQALFTGIFFLMLPIFYIFSGIHLLRSQRNTLKQKTLLIAATFIGSMYMHHAFSRAALNHLAQGIHPMLIGIISLPSVFQNKYKKLISVVLLAIIFSMSCYLGITGSPFYKKASDEEHFVSVNIDADKIWVDKNTAHLINIVRHINDEYVKPGEELLIAPHWPTFYPILKRKSPLWEIFIWVKETEERQNEIISEIKEKNVHWVILRDIPFDGRDDLRFRSTHNLVWQYLMDYFEPIQIDGLPIDFQLLHRKNKLV